VIDVVQNVLTADDFDRILDDYAGSVVSHTPVTKTTSNKSGKETLSDGTAANIKCYFMRTGQNWDYVKAGFIERGAAVILAKYADSVAMNDKITFKGVVYRVRERFDVPGVFDSTGANTTYTYTACNLFLEE